MKRQVKPVWGKSARELELDDCETPMVIPGGSSSPTTNNHIFFYKDVGEDSVADLNNKILSTRKGIIKDALDFDIDGNSIPIHLHIHSYGGSLLAGFAASGMVARNNVHTHIEGAAASAATFMSICGSHRTITAQSFMLIHQISSEFWGKHAEIEDWQKNINRFMDTMIKMYAERTRLPKTKLREILKHDLWFSAEEALRYGLVDEIL
jgi:ATP-dependent Clp endopeptidase proteolytic subunit ClpP